MIAYRPEDKLPKNIVGRTFRVLISNENKGERAMNVTAVKEYPHHILFVREDGIRECFSRWQLARTII